MSCLNKLQKDFKRYFLSSVRCKDPLDSTRSVLVSVIILGIWLSLVIFTETRHEFWRDEVRALSIVRTAGSPFDLYDLIRYDGHPVLWYLLLYIGKSIANSPLILPVTSIVVAFAAVIVFWFFSPFSFGIRCLFIFCALPFYEYSVMARNYGISMLLMFVGATLYKRRMKYPFLLAFVLALLANTNVHSAILACLIAGLWAWDMIVDRRMEKVRGRGFTLYLPFVIVLAGVLLCAAFAMPRENTILTTVNNISVSDVAYSFAGALLRPGKTFPAFMPKEVPDFVVGLFVYLAVFGLLQRPSLFLAALGALIAYGIFFRVAYPGWYRHQGLFLVFLLFLYWLFIESFHPNRVINKTKRRLFYIGFYVAMITLISVNVAKSIDKVWTDIRMEKSSAKAFGEFLNTSKAYENAIIIFEPDGFLESLPYYAKNRIYIPREHRFGTTVSWTTESDYSLSLGELLSIAQDIKTSCDQPVLIALGHWDVDRYNHREKHFSYNKVFTWNKDELDDFKKSTIVVTEFKAAQGGENYRIYDVR